MELPPEKDIADRLDTVLHITYLLFNEGYYSKTQNQILRKDLCLEAMRLCIMLTENEQTNLPKTNALMALMCFHASRFNARQSGNDSLILYEQQNEELWDQELIRKGMHFLQRSASGNDISAYHIESRIAYWHCTKEDSGEKWEDILRLYDQLLQINYSPGAALNRIFALYKARGYQTALIEAEQLRLESNHFYYVLLGELHKNSDTEKANMYFQKAYALAKTETEKEMIAAKFS